LEKIKNLNEEVFTMKLRIDELKKEKMVVYEYAELA
jgi:hypothetical protein